MFQQKNDIESRLRKIVLELKIKGFYMEAGIVEKIVVRSSTESIPVALPSRVV